jgi:hypothetical protein
MRMTWIVLIAACKGSDPAGADGAVPAIDATAIDAPIVDRVAAATTTAQTNALCTAIAPFYWEIGDVNALLASGSIGTDAPNATTVMAIASASKWLFGGYAIEKLSAMPSADDITLMNFTSGYAGFASDACPPAGTVDDCLAGASGMIVPSAVGKFDYNGAHLQTLASRMGLGSMKNAALAAEVRSQIGAEIAINYSEPQPAGGVYTSADQYVLFLRKLLVGSTTPLLLATMLGDDTVCTNPNTCADAVYSPIPKGSSTESWHYGLAHWIEDDPIVGDGAFSSAGAFGFYPWVDSTRTLYGVLARKGDAGQGYDSAQCGRLIRKAWVTGIAQ